MKKKVLSALLAICLILLAVCPVFGQTPYVDQISPPTITIHQGETFALDAYTIPDGYNDVDWWVKDTSIVQLGSTDRWGDFSPFTPKYEGYYYDDYREYYYNENGIKTYVRNGRYGYGYCAYYDKGTSHVTIYGADVGETVVTAMVSGTESVACTVKVVEPGAYIENEYYAVNIQTDGNGKVTPRGKVYVAANTRKTFTITPDAGYVVDKVIVDYKRELDHSDTQFSLLVDAPYNINVTFKPAPAVTPAPPAASTPSTQPGTPSTSTPTTTPPTTNPQTGDGWFANLFL